MHVNEERLAELYQQTYRNGYFLARSRLQDESEALDVLHDAYVSVFQNIESIKDEEHFAKYLTKTIHNRCIDFLKKKRPQVFAESREEDFDLEDFIEDHHEIEFHPEKEFEYKELKEALMKIIHSLPDEQKTCLLLYYYEQYSIAEIAEILDVSENTVKSRLSYGKKKVKAEIEEMEKKGIHLHSVSPAMLLLWLFKEESTTMALPQAITTSLLKEVTASSLKGASATASNASAASVAKASGGVLHSMGVKITLVGALTIGGVGIGVATLGGSSNNNDVHPTSNQAEKLVIDQSTPEGFIKSYFDSIRLKDKEALSSLYIECYITNAASLQDVTYESLMQDFENSNSFNEEGHEPMSVDTIIDHPPNTEKITNIQIQDVLHQEDDVIIYSFSADIGDDSILSTAFLVKEGDLYYVPKYAAITNYSSDNDEYDLYFPITPFMFRY